MLNTQPTPFPSIIIPALNEEANIGRCLASIADMNILRDLYEVIVVDNGSTDKTREIAQSFKGQMNISVIIAPRVTIAALRNIGVKHSHGDILSFVDADCTVSGDWLRNAVCYFTDHTIGAVGSSYTIPKSASWVAKVWTMNSAKKRIRGETEYISTANLHVSRVNFEKIGGFNENLITNEDYDLCFRLKQLGLTIYADPKIHVVHWGNPANLRDFYRREKWHGSHVFNVFLDDIRKLKNIRAISYALYYVACSICLLLGFLHFLIYGKLMPILLTSGAVIFPPSLLSVKTIIQQKGRFYYFFPLFIVYFTYGVARAVSLAKNIWGLVSKNQSIESHWSSKKLKKLQ